MTRPCSQKIWPILTYVWFFTSQTHSVLQNLFYLFVSRLIKNLIQKCHNKLWFKSENEHLSASHDNPDLYAPQWDQLKNKKWKEKFCKKKRRIFVTDVSASTPRKVRKVGERLRVRPQSCRGSLGLLSILLLCSITYTFRGRVLGP